MRSTLSLLLLMSLYCSTPSSAELKISDVHECLLNADVYFFGNSVSRGTYEALSQILNVTEQNEHWQSNITEFGHHIKHMHNRKAEKESCPFKNKFIQTINGITLPHSCDEVYYNRTAKQINVMYVYWQRIFSKSLVDTKSFFSERVRLSPSKRIIILYNAGTILTLLKCHSYNHNHKHSQSNNNST